MKKIATKIAKKLQKYDSTNIVSLEQYRELKEKLLHENKNLYNAQAFIEQGYDPQHAVYASVQNFLTFIIEIMDQSLPELCKHGELGLEATDIYMPSWPPMSPVSVTFFNTWLSFDLRLGVDQESYASCAIELHQQLGIEHNLKHLLTLMDQSRLGVYKTLEQIGNKLLLEELFTKKHYLCFSPNNHPFTRHELWLTRLLPPITEKLDYYIVFTSPYILQARPQEWQAFFERNVKNIEKKYEILMKSGLSNYYWLEYILQSYSKATDLVIYLKGMPDIGISRPHFYENDNILIERKY